VVEVNQTGVFNHEANGVYYLTAYSSGACIPPAHTLVNVPHLPGSCSYMMKNSACQTSWEFSLDSVSADHYTMVYAPGDTVPGIRSVNAHQPVINFYEVQPGNHTLISDSGCVWPLYFDSLPVMGSISYSSISCGGTPSIYINDTPQAFCNAILTRVYYEDSLIASGPAPLRMNVLDSGWYSYKFYTISYAGDTSLVKYDTICPLDSGVVYVGYGSLPYPFPATLYECGSAAPPAYHIYGGQIPYTVEIPGYDTVVLNSNTGIFPTAAPGVYYVIAYDNCGISHSFNFTILDTCTAVICGTIIARNDTTVCIGSNVLLTSTVTVSGGTYSWSPGTGSAPDTLVSPAATATYIVSYNLNRCPLVSDTVTVTVISAPQVNVNDTNVCIGQSAMLTATSSPTGGSYSWSPGGGGTQNITISPQTNTTYTVTYLIAGCPPAVDSSIVTIADTPTVSVSTVAAICYSPSGSASAFAVDGSPPYGFVWSDAAHTATISLDSLYPGGTYTVTVSDLYHCTSSASGLIGDSIESLDIVPDSLSNVSCYGVHDGYISVRILNSSHASYQWSPAGTDSVLSGLTPGTYSLTATDPVGCRDTISFTITEPLPVSLSIAPNDSTLKEGDSLSFNTLLSPYPTGSLSYDWSPNIGLSCYDCAQPVFNSTSGVYHYTLVINYNGVCSVSDTVSVKVYSTHQIYVPNAFTPNGDGVNDVYQVFPIGAKYISLRIFNRWGERVFESLDVAKGWDGKYKGTLQPPGVYVYLVDVTFNDGYTAHDKGSVTLIR
jgi:gliding motility-associated-like protein